MKRAFSAPPQDQRCKAVVTLRRGEWADCMRAARIGSLCIQHSKIADRVMSEQIEQMGHEGFRGCGSEQ